MRYKIVKHRYDYYTVHKKTLFGWKDVTTQSGSTSGFYYLEDAMNLYRRLIDGTEDWTITVVDSGNPNLPAYPDYSAWDSNKPPYKTHDPTKIPERQTQ